MTDPLQNQRGLRMEAFVLIPDQFRHARHLLGWSVDRAASDAGITTDQVRSLESETQDGAAIFKLEDCYRAAGVQFECYADDDGQSYVAAIPGTWVRTRRLKSQGRL